MERRADTSHGPALSKQQQHVPWMAERILRALLPKAVREAMLADLAAAVADPRRPSPRRWYWRQTLAALWPLTLVTLHLQARGIMPEAHAPDAPGLSIWSDFHFAMRRMRRRPALALSVVALLTLGVTSAATVFSIFSRAARAEGRGSRSDDAVRGTTARLCGNAVLRISPGVDRRRRTNERRRQRVCIDSAPRCGSL